MSGFLFLLVMDWVMRRTVGEGENGIRWKLTSKLDHLDFADDVALLSSTRQHIQEKTTRMSEAAKQVGLKINLRKTKVLRINAKKQTRITIDGQDIEDVQEFTYLGAKVCQEGGGMENIKNRLAKARGAFVKFKRIWNSNNISRVTKLRLYKTLVLPVLLYGCETWKINQGDDKSVDVFQSKCLRRILRVRWEDYIKTADLLKRSGMKPLRQEVRLRRWKMIGHILRQERENDCNVAMSWAPEGRRWMERPKTP